MLAKSTESTRFAGLFFTFVDSAVHPSTGEWHASSVNRAFPPQ
jgi:hypothetical protein